MTTKKKVQKNEKPDGNYQWKKVMSANEVTNMLKKNGWDIISQHGSHIKLRKNGYICIVPNHKEIKEGTLGNIKRIVNFAETK